MTTAHFVEKARKCPQRGSGIRKGDSYWWWQFAFGPKHVSKIKPKRSQLTRSWFRAAMYDAEDDLADALWLFRGSNDFQTLSDACSAAADAVEEVRDQCEENLNNLPESLQNAPSGEQLTQRIEQCDSIASDLRVAAEDIASAANSENEKEEDVEEVATEVANLIEAINWEYD